VAAAKKQGVDERDIQTTNINLYPNYASGSQARIVGYSMTEEVRISVHDIDKAGAVIDGATAAHANTVDGIAFDIADPAAAQDQARVVAVGAARTRADAMAKAAGVSLGGVLSISDVSIASPAPYPVTLRAFAAAADKATPVLPGTQDLDAQVTVVFEIH